MVHGEDHTFGNSFRYVLAKNRDVDFVGYSIPHPSEMKLNMRIQTKGQSSGGGRTQTTHNDTHDTDRSIDRIRDGGFKVRTIALH